MSQHFRWATRCKQRAVHCFFYENKHLTHTKQGAVHFSPRPYAQYRWATRLQARCDTLPYNHLSSYIVCTSLNPFYYECTENYLRFAFSAFWETLRTTAESLRPCHIIRWEEKAHKRRVFSSFCMARRLSPGFYLRSGCSSKRIFYFFLRHFRCPTTVVQLPHSCGATASQLWCNCPTAVGQRKYPL